MAARPYLGGLVNMVWLWLRGLGDEGGEGQVEFEGAKR